MGWVKAGRADFNFGAGRVIFTVIVFSTGGAISGSDVNMEFFVRLR